MLKKISKLKEIYLPLNIQMFAQRKSWIEKNNTSLSYNDVTTEWLKNTNPNSHKVLDAKYFVFKKNKYIVDGINVILDYSKKEKEVAEWLESIFGGKIYMVPRVNKPEGVQTADYLFKNEYWDLKEINGNGKNVFFHAVEKHEKQAHNFLFDVSNSILTDSDIDNRINSLYKLPKLQWLNKIIIKRGKNLIMITKKK